MIELFSKKLDAIDLSSDAVLTPIPINDEVSSLSAILLDDDYYEFLKRGKVTLDNVTVLNAPYLIPFKAKAWLELSNLKTKGEHVDSKNIKKHKNDVFRLTALIDPSTQIKSPREVYDDMQLFLTKMQDEHIDLKQIGIEGTTKEKIISELEFMYVKE